MKKDFEFIYHENYLILYKFLLKIGCPPQDIDDVIQDTFVKAILNIDQFKNESKLSVWLCQIAKNTWYSYLKKNKNIVTIDENHFKDDHSYFINFIDYIEEPYKSVFTLKEIMGYSYQEIACKYNKSESWARVTYYRARMKYQKLFEEVES